jgi:hypothetical protein
MRIKGGPKTTRAQGAAKAKKAGKAGKADFSGLVGDEPLDTEEEARKVRSRLMEELSDLADEVASGETTKEEASRKFVGMVIKDRYGNEAGKGAKKMEENIADLVEDDPNFVSRLHSQLKKLSKS